MDFKNVRKQLFELGRDAAWLAGQFQVEERVVQNWLEGSPPDEPVTVVLKVGFTDDESVDVKLDLEEYLRWELKAKREGIDLAEMIAHAIKASLKNEPG